MRKSFNSLAEFYLLSDGEKLGSKIDEIVRSLDLKKLGKVLTCHFLLTTYAVKSWIREVESKLGLSIKLRIVKEESVPYMKEDGLLCFSKKDVSRKERIFMLSAHEAAHFILMKDSEYESVKRINEEYLQTNTERASMRSPIEYCANLVTLKVLDGVKNVAKSRKTRDTVMQIADSLKKQLT